MPLHRWIAKYIDWYSHKIEIVRSNKEGKQQKKIGTSNVASIDTKLNKINQI